MNIKLIIVFIYLFMSLSITGQQSDSIPLPQDTIIITNPLLNAEPKKPSTWSIIKDLFL